MNMSIQEQSKAAENFVKLLDELIGALADANEEIARLEKSLTTAFDEIADLHNDIDKIMENGGMKR